MFKTTDKAIPFTVTINLNARVPVGTDPKSLTPEAALDLCRGCLEDLGGSNDGSEILANAEPQLINE